MNKAELIEEVSNQTGLTKKGGSMRCKNLIWIVVVLILAIRATPAVSAVEADIDYGYVRLKDFTNSEAYGYNILFGEGGGWGVYVEQFTTTTKENFPGTSERKTFTLSPIILVVHVEPAELWVKKIGRKSDSFELGVGGISVRSHDEHLWNPKLRLEGLNVALLLKYKINYSFTKNLSLGLSTRYLLGCFTIRRRCCLTIPGYRIYHTTWDTLSLDGFGVLLGLSYRF